MSKPMKKKLLQLCSNTSYYASGSQFQTNLNLLLDSLVSNGAQDGYFNTSVGVSPDTVYGLSQCKDDISMASCRSCLKTAAINITLNCTNGVNATLRYDHCLLRYSGSRFFSVRSTHKHALYYLANISDTDISSFTQQRDDLMNDLSKTAVSRLTRFSFGDTVYAPSKTIYGAVQCTRDLSPRDCEDCLSHMITWTPDCCNTSKGVQLSTKTCYLRYDTETFIEDSSQFPPMPAPTFAPVPPPTPVLTLSPQSSPEPILTSNTTNIEESNGTNGGKSLNILLIIAPIIASLVFG